MDQYYHLISVYDKNAVSNKCLNFIEHLMNRGALKLVLEFLPLKQNLVMFLTDYNVAMVTC